MTGEAPQPPPATGSGIQVVAPVSLPGVVSGGPVVARPSPASVSGAALPFRCTECNEPKSAHKFLRVCPSGTAYDVQLGKVDVAVKVRPETLVTAAFKEVLDQARRDGTKFENLPKPEEHGCRNTRIIKEIDGSVYAIPADAMGVGLDIGEAIKNTTKRFGWKRIGLAGFVLMMILGNVYQFAFSPVDAVATTAQPNSTAAPAPIAGSDDAYRALCISLYNGGDMTVEQERVFWAIEGIEVEGE